MWDTKIVDKGLGLSENFKTRISLARAIYSNNEIILIDDVLANLDNDSADFIYHKVIKGLLKNKLVVLVTSQKWIADKGDKLLYMSKGSQSILGSIGDQEMQAHMKKR